MVLLVENSGSWCAHIWKLSKLRKVVIKPSIDYWIGIEIFLFCFPDNLITIKGRAFGVMTPRSWNSLPFEFCQAPLLSAFKIVLKSILVAQNFSSSNHMAPLRLQLELWKHEKQTRTSQILSIANQGERAFFRLKTKDLSSINKKAVWATVTNFISPIFINIIKNFGYF